MLKSIIKKLLGKSKPHLNEGYFQVYDSISKKKIWMYMRADSYMEREFYNKGLYGDWEKESLKIWAYLCKQANHILDIGANTGVFSLIAKSQNAAANVYSIEPINTNFDVLTKNIVKNNYDIRAEKVALSDKEGLAKMFMLKDRLNYMTSVNDNRYARHPEIQGDAEVVEVEVPIKTCKQIQEKYNIPKIDLIKIDVEGHEVEVLSAMYEQLKKDKPTILIEVIGDDNAKSLNRMFKDLDYQFISINETNVSVKVEHLWDNDHHNFLLCNDDVISYLQSKGLVK